MLNQMHNAFAQLFEKYADSYHRVDVAPKTILLAEGDVSKKACLIEKGCIRAWFNNKGKDVTFQFFFDNEAVSSIESFNRNTPSMYSLETVEQSVLHWIKKSDWQVIQQEIDSNPEMRNMMANNALDRQLNYMRHFMDIIKYTPKERYLHLLSERPDIIKRIPQHYIASYLGITSVSLSRIRNSVVK